jgi:hypothetical protein
LLQQSGLAEKRVPELLRQYEGRLWRKQKGMRSSFRYYLLDSSGEEDEPPTDRLQ